MNEKQIGLIMEIIQEQLEDYLADELAADIMTGIEEGINDNQMSTEEIEMMSGTHAVFQTEVKA